MRGTRRPDGVACFYGNTMASLAQLFSSFMILEIGLNPVKFNIVKTRRILIRNSDA